MYSNSATVRSSNTTSLGLEIAVSLSLVHGFGTVYHLPCAVLTWIQTTAEDVLVQCWGPCEYCATY